MSQANARICRALRAVYLADVRYPTKKTIGLRLWADDKMRLADAQAYRAAYRFVWQYMERAPDPDSDQRAHQNDRFCVRWRLVHRHPVENGSCGLVDR